jgi:hypothetical protein
MEVPPNPSLLFVLYSRRHLFFTKLHHQEMNLFFIKREEDSE